MELVFEGILALTLAVLIGVSIFFVSRHSPTIAAYAIIFALPSYLIRLRWDQLATNALEVSMAAFIFAVLLRSFTSTKEKNRLSFPFFENYGAPLLLFLLGAALASAFSPKELQWMSVGILKGWFILPIAFAAALSKSRIAPATLLKPLIFSGIAIALFSLGLALFSLFWGPITISSPTLTGVHTFLTYDYRLRGIFLSPNHLAMYLVPLWLMAYGIWQRGTKNMRTAWFLALLAMAIALFFTQSLGAWIGIGAGLAFFHRVFLTRPFTIRLFLVALVLLGLLVPFFAVEFSDLFVAHDDRSPLASRIMIWRAAEEILKDNWLFGIGPGTFQHHYLALQEKYPPYLEWAVPQPHNLFLAVWLQTGLLGLVGFLWLLARAFRNVLRSEGSADSRMRIMQIAAASALAAIIVHGLVDTPFWKNDLAALFFVLFLLIVPNSTSPTLPPAPASSSKKHSLKSFDDRKSILV